MGIRALMQGDKNQYVDHIIETNTKFMQLLKDMAKERINLEDRLLHCQEREEKLMSLRNHYRDLHQRTDNDFKEMDDRLRQQIKELRDKLGVDREVRMDLQGQIEKLTKSVQDSKLKNEELSKYISEKKLMDDIQREIDDDEERILKEQILAKTEILDACRTTRDAAKKYLDSDERLSDLKKKNAEFNDELKKKQIEASDVEYRVVEIEARQQLAIKYKEREAEDRKNLYEEHEILKDKLEEEKRKNEERINKKLRESSFEELGKRDIVLRKLQEELATLKVQYDKIHKEYKNFKLDEFRKNNYLNKLKAENEVNQKDYDTLEAQRIELQNVVDGLKSKVEDQAEKLKELKMLEENAKRTALSLKAEHEELDARVQYITKNLDMDALLKNVNIEELNKVIDSNKQVTSVLSELMTKWRGINDFSHGKVSSSENPA